MGWVGFRGGALHLPGHHDRGLPAVLGPQEEPAHDDIELLLLHPDAAVREGSEMIPRASAISSAENGQSSGSIMDG